MGDNKLKTAFRNHFKAAFGKAPTQEQVIRYQNYILGKEDDLKSVEKVCGVSLAGKFANRTAYRYQYEFVYDSIPTEEQLDVFIAYRVGILKNDKLLNEVCSKNAQDIQPSL